MHFEDDSDKETLSLGAGMIDQSPDGIPAPLFQEAAADEPELEIEEILGEQPNLKACILCLKTYQDTTSHAIMWECTIIVRCYLNSRIVSTCKHKKTTSSMITLA